MTPAGSRACSSHHPTTCPRPAPPVRKTRHNSQPGFCGRALCPLFPSDLSLACGPSSGIVAVACHFAHEGSVTQEPGCALLSSTSSHKPQEHQHRRTSHLQALSCRHTRASAVLHTTAPTGTAAGPLQPAASSPGDGGSSLA